MERGGVHEHGGVDVECTALPIESVVSRCAPYRACVNQSTCVDQIRYGILDLVYPQVDAME